MFGLFRNILKFTASRVSKKDLAQTAMDGLFGDLSDEQKDKLKEDFKTLLKEAGKAYIASQLK